MTKKMTNTILAAVNYTQVYIIALEPQRIEIIPYDFGCLLQSDQLSVQFPLNIIYRTINSKVCSYQLERLLSFVTDLN